MIARPEQEFALEIDDFSLDFHTARGRMQAIRHVSFAVKPGRIVGVVGESGSGKTTIAAAALNFLTANAEVRSGAIRIAGRNVLAMGPAELRDVRGKEIAMVFQDPMTALNPVLTIGTQMGHIQHREKGLSHRQKRARSAAMLTRVGIPDAEARLDAYPHAFSGGMRQRIAIAMAVLCRPRVLIADEPTTALDATTEVQITALLRELQQETGCAVLFISHSLGLIAQLCDEVVVMYAGRVVEQGAAAEIFANPQHPYTRALLETDPAFLPRMMRTLPTIGGEFPDLVFPTPGCAFAPRCSMAEPRCSVEVPAPRRASASGTVVRCHAVAGEAI